MKIEVSARAQKQLKRLPTHIQIKFEYWCDLIESIGLREARQYKGFHDEPLKGKRVGQHSVRLSKSYRVIYIEYGILGLIEVLEVNKHDY